MTHGFDLAGPPRALQATLRASCNRPEPLMETQFMLWNDWHCVGCGTDQGLLFYVFHVLRHGAYRQTEATGPRVAHWWAHPKPWECTDDADLARRVDYFASLELLNAPPRAAACVGELRALRARATSAAAREREREPPNFQAPLMMLANASAAPPVVVWRAA